MTILQKIRPSIYTVPYGQFCQVSSINQFCTDTFRAPRKKRRLFQSAFSSPSRRLRHAASTAIPAFPAKSRPLRKEAHTGSRRIRFRTQKRGAKMRNLPDEFQGAGRGLLPGRCGKPHAGLFSRTRRQRRSVPFRERRRRRKKLRDDKVMLPSLPEKYLFR